MHPKEEMAHRLKETAGLIEWAMLLIPEDRLLEEPPHGDHPQANKGFKTYFGDWSAHRHLFHLVFYEQAYALPGMRQWLGGPFPDPVLPDAEETAWREGVQSGPDLPGLLKRFRSVRQEQIEVLDEISEEAWAGEEMDTGWGRVAAGFVVSKTIQHTLEHGDALLRNALYWERAWAWLDSQG